jgi:NifU-like protein involved in Fe-S cluster formation
MDGQSFMSLGHTQSPENYLWLQGPACTCTGWTSQATKRIFQAAVDYFTHLKHAGSIEDPGSLDEVGDCVAATIVSDTVSEMAQGRKPEEAKTITLDAGAEILGSLLKSKMCLGPTWKWRPRP